MGDSGGRKRRGCLARMLGDGGTRLGQKYKPGWGGRRRWWEPNLNTSKYRIGAVYWPVREQYWFPLCVQFKEVNNRMGPTHAAMSVLVLGNQCAQTKYVVVSVGNKWQSCCSCGWQLYFSITVLVQHLCRHLQQPPTERASNEDEESSLAASISEEPG